MKGRYGRDFSSLYGSAAGMRKRLAELGYMTDVQDTKKVAGHHLKAIESCCDLATLAHWKLAHVHLRLNRSVASPLLSVSRRTAEPIARERLIGD
jgi:hypothetical protein